MDKPAAGALSHAAFFYRGDAEYTARITAFAQAGLARDEPVLIALPGAKSRMISDCLETTPGELAFADMAELGRNPARIIPELVSFTDKHPGQRIRYVGEPLWPGRSAAEACEAAWHEALLNLAFAQVQATILCPYDAAGLAGSVLDAARRTHAGPAACGAAAGNWRDNLPPECDRPLGPPPAEAEGLYYDTDLAPVRRLVERYALGSGLSQERAADLVLAANEIAANTIGHTTGGGVIHVWQTDAEIICQVHDSGQITDPLAGRVRHGPGDRGHGLWLVNHVCDLVELRSGEAGTTVRMHARRKG